MSNKMLELKCVRCRLRLPIERFYKAARKLDEPECIRCTAWTCAAEPDVVPPALESGHVSIEEIQGDEPDATGFGVEIRELHRGIDESDLLALNEGTSSIASQSEGGAQFYGGSPSTYGPPSSVHGRGNLPAHLASSAASEASYADDTEAAPRYPGRAMSVMSSSTARLPAHLSGTRAESISTATTYREVKVAGGVSFNRWDSKGNQRAGLRPATTISSMASESGFTESSARTRSVAGESTFPKPEREKYRSEFTPHFRTKKAAEQIREEREIGFCDSDGELHSDDDDWR